METGENIKRLRQQLKMSQSELASKAGYNDRSSIAKIESGKVDLSQSKIAIFADILGVTPAELMGIGEQVPIDTVDEDLREYLDELRTRPEMRMLFSTTKTATRAEIEAIVKFIESLHGEGGDPE